MKKALTSIVLCLFTLTISAQNGSWNARFISAVSPAYTDSQQKDTLNKLLRIAETEDIKEAKPLYYNALAAYYYQVEKPESMITYLYKAIELNRKQDNKTLLSTNYNLLSIYHQEQQNYDKALEAIQQAIFYLDTLKQSILHKIYLSNLAAIHFMKEDYISAKDIYEKNIDFYLAVQDTVSYLSDLYNLAFSYYKLKDFEKSKNTIEKFLKTYYLFSEKSEIQDLLANIYGTLEKISFDQGMYTSALLYQNRKLEIARTLNNYAMLSEVYERRSETHERLGQYEEALRSSKLAAQYKDSLLNETRLKALAEMESKYESKIKTLELQDAKNKISIEQRKKKQYLALSLLIATVLIGSSIVVYQKIKLNKKELMLYDEKINKLIKDHELETANALLRGQDMEREHIATELHDRLGSMMGNIKLHLQVLAKKLSFDEHLKSELQSTAELIKEAADEIRRISHNLSTGIVHRYGLKAAVEEFSNQISKSGMIQIEVEFTPVDFPRLDRDLETQIYRIIQEFTSNTLKHARASVVHLFIAYLNDEIQILFEDNGRGFEVNKKSRGIGIFNIENRISKINGSMEIDSKPGRGTAISITIPVKKKSLA
ncbi:two-component sensor histidine kinase [Thermaurantimonas aggregans]|uniref:Oxygen sensor histidine kinase NreB n=1 Tax=Thermaurantimonas aggregans TaxID=2173829 RepID=A0A401XKC5_9FLAO|nr:tetratricopeptide repeat protein [Thermaurantimonas aggregans]MCX8148358.1 histidine kinase [Thermaurantimonas aggregans]GCD77452.1 two-component sensor histidine kinase [Thermaurantimonas aggregans]